MAVPELPGVPGGAGGQYAGHPTLIMFLSTHRPLSRIVGICLCIMLSIVCVVMILAFAGAVQYEVWYPRFDLKDVRIHDFNVTNGLELNYDMDIVIEAYHFSSIRRIEDHSYKVITEHCGTVFGESYIPRFHPNNSRTMIIFSTQSARRLPLGDYLGDLVIADLNATGRIALRVYMEGTMTVSVLFLNRKKKHVTCDLIVSPATPLGLQIITSQCCRTSPFRKIATKNFYHIPGNSTYYYECDQHSPSCCALPPADIRSTARVCN